MPQRRKGLIQFMRRVGRENPQNARKFKLMRGFAGEDEMPKMRRIKCAAEESNLCAGHAASISQSFIGHFCVLYKSFTLGGYDAVTKEINDDYK